jgi:hypothetical protein
MEEERQRQLLVPTLLQAVLARMELVSSSSSRKNEGKDFS